MRNTIPSPERRKRKSNSPVKRNDLSALLSSQQAPRTLCNGPPHHAKKPTSRMLFPSQSAWAPPTRDMSRTTQHMPCDSDTTAIITSNGKTRILNEKGGNEKKMKKKERKKEKKNKKRLLWFHGRSAQQGWAPGGKETPAPEDVTGSARAPGGHFAFRIR